MALHPLSPANANSLADIVPKTGTAIRNRSRQPM